MGPTSPIQIFTTANNISYNLQRVFSITSRTLVTRAQHIHQAEYLAIGIKL